MKPTYDNANMREHRENKNNLEPTNVALCDDLSNRHARTMATPLETQLTLQILFRHANHAGSTCVDAGNTNDGFAIANATGQRKCGQNIMKLQRGTHTENRPQDCPTNQHTPMHNHAHFHEETHQTTKRTMSETNGPCTGWCEDTNCYAKTHALNQWNHETMHKTTMN